MHYYNKFPSVPVQSEGNTITGSCLVEREQGDHGPGTSEGGNARGSSDWKGPWIIRREWAPGTPGASEGSSGTGIPAIEGVGQILVGELDAGLADYQSFTFC